MTHTPGSARPRTTQTVVTALRGAGFDFVAGDQVGAWLGEAAMAHWPAFAASWDDLGPDLFMADGGRYRRRRHAALAVGPDGARRKPHQPHFQSRDYNALNGGVQRWFEPIQLSVTESPVLLGLLGLADKTFRAATPAPPPVWHVEVHQFRIEAQAGQAGHPTPEGLHRDGVDWVLVALIGRSNVAEGITQIADAGGAALDRFTLANPLDTAFLDDHRVRHGVTPIHRLDADQPGCRDALVITLTRQGPESR